MTQAGHRHNLHHFDALLVQPHDLLAPLVQLLQCLVSCVFFFHDLNMGTIARYSRLQWAESIVKNIFLFIENYGTIDLCQSNFLDQKLYRLGKHPGWVAFA
jgi:hypothetical protein